jgi:hypothetical protein
MSLDQRSIMINMVGMFMVLFLIVSVYCFFKYVRLRSRRWGNYISQRRFEIHRYHQRRNCNRMLVAVVAIVAICWGFAEAGIVFF